MDVNDIFITENWAVKELLCPKFFGRNNQIYFHPQPGFIYTVETCHFEPLGKTQILWNADSTWLEFKSKDMIYCSKLRGIQNSRVGISKIKL